MRLLLNSGGDTGSQIMWTLSDNLFCSSLGESEEPTLLSLDASQLMDRTNSHPQVKIINHRAIKSALKMVWNCNPISFAVG